MAEVLESVCLDSAAATMRKQAKLDSVEFPNDLRRILARIPSALFVATDPSRTLRQSRLSRSWTSFAHSELGILT